MNLFCSRLPLLALASLIMLPAEWAVAQQEVGPWVGEPGYTETTADIMERAAGYLRGPKTGKKHRRHLLGRRNWETLVQSPDATDLPAPGDLPLAGPAQATALSFTGATLYDTRSFPPDSMGVAGPSQFIVAVNGRIRSFNKSTGMADGVLDVNPDVFFSSVMTPPSTNNFTSDPRIRYDRLSGRWFLIIIDVPQMSGDVPNRILLAVSGGPVITPSTTWTFFQFQHDLPTPTSKTDTGAFADYPTLGIDAQALYIGVNIFGTRGLGSFANTTAFVIRKSSVLGAGPIVVKPFRDLVGNGLQGGPYTLQGVDNYDPGATEGYFIGVDSAYYGRLILNRVTNPGGNPSLSGNIVINVPATGGTINVQHQGNTGGSSGALDGLDYRLIAAHIRNGRLWTCANLAVDNTGSPSGTDSRMGVRWYELSGLAGGQTPMVVQSGTIFEPSSSNDAAHRSYWMGSVMVSGQGHALLGFSVAGANERINAGYAGRLVSDAPGTFRTPMVYTASTASYNPPSDPGGSAGRRWGDYSFTSLDPSDDMTMWTIQEWCDSENSYGVQVAKVLAPPPATPLLASPSTISAGQSNVVVVVQGAVVDGSGFFDPGPGFSNRIAAVVSGSGVTVGSVAYSNPSNLTLLVSAAAGASSGIRDILVTNPDGQSALGASLLTILGAPQTNRPPVLAAIADQTVMEESPLVLTALAVDPDGDTLTFSFGAPPPAGAVIDSATGVFSWTPSEGQGPGTNLVSVRVSEAGVSGLSDARSFSVVVLESNLPPVLAPIPSRIIHAGAEVSFTSTANDADAPANILTFGLASGPAGATLDPGSGVFSWMTSDADAGTTNTVTIAVFDDGFPSLTDSQTTSIAVLSRPSILNIQEIANSVAVTWSSIPGQGYRIQTAADIGEPAWSEPEPRIIAEGWTTTSSYTKGEGKKFFRVRVD